MKNKHIEKMKSSSESKTIGKYGFYMDPNIYRKVYSKESLLEELDKGNFVTLEWLREFNISKKKVELRSRIILEYRKDGTLYSLYETKPSNTFKLNHSEFKGNLSIDDIPESFKTIEGEILRVTVKRSSD